MIVQISFDGHQFFIFNEEDFPFEELVGGGVVLNAIYHLPIGALPHEDCNQVEPRFTLLGVLIVNLRPGVFQRHTFVKILQLTVLVPMMCVGYSKINVLIIGVQRSVQNYGANEGTLISIEVNVEVFADPDEGLFKVLFDYQLI